MANYSNMVITNKGKSLYAKIQAGAPLNFTRMQIGGGLLANGQDPQTLTALIKPLASLAINAISSDNNTAHVKGIFENSNITASTYSCELGLFATDPDLGEILYAYANAGGQGDTIPPISAGPFSKQYKINTAVGNASSVTATIPAETFIPVTDKGVPNGVATLGGSGVIPATQMAATTAATANTVMQRDENGQSNVGVPTAASHIARKQDVDGVNQSVTDLRNGLGFSTTATDVFEDTGTKNLNMKSGGIAFLSGKTASQLTSNCYYDGANWQRIDTSKGAYRLRLSDSNTLEYWYAVAGANPITAWSSTPLILADCSRPFTGNVVTPVGLASGGYNMPDSTTPAADLAGIPVSSFYTGNVSNKAGYPHTYGAIYGYSGSSNNWGYAYQMFFADVVNALYFRRATSGTTWGTWQKTYHTGNVSDGNFFMSRGVLASNANWNNITTAGSYWVGDTGAMTNHPSLASWLLLEVSESNGYIVQRATSMISSVSKYRQRNDGLTWGPWMQTIFSNGSNGQVVLNDNLTVDSAGSIWMRGTSMAPTRVNNGMMEFWDGGTWKVAGGLKNVQRGTASLIAGNTNVTIGAVNMSKAVVSFDNLVSISGSTIITAQLTSATNLLITNNGGTTGTVAWQVSEFY